MLVENQASKDLLSDLQNLFDLESFGKTLEVLRSQVSNTCVKDFNKFLDAILQFKIHKFKGKNPDKYISSLKRKLSVIHNEKLTTKKFQLFLSICEPILNFIEDTVIEVEDTSGEIKINFDSVSMQKYIKHGVSILKPLADVPGVIQILNAVNIMQEISAEEIIFQISMIKEKISLLTRYSQELIRSIDILKKQIDIKDKKERNQIDSLKTKQRGILIELSTNIGLLSGLYCQIQSNSTTKEDELLIEELFSMNIQVDSPSLDPVFVEIVELIMKQIVNKPTMIKVAPIINKLISDADLAYMKKKQLSGDAMQLIQRLVIIGSNCIDFMSNKKPERYRRLGAPENKTLDTSQTPYTRSMLVASTFFEIGHFYNSFQILRFKSHEIDRKVIEMHKKIIEDVFKFLGAQVEIDSTIQSLHNQYQTILDTTALHNQGIKSDADYYNELYTLYDKILNLYKAKFEIMEAYKKIRTGYNLPSQIIVDGFEKTKLDHKK